MKRLLFFWLIFSCLFSKGQQRNYSTVSVPADQTTSTVSIARYINANLNSDREKLQAIYSWVTGNIKYDTDSMYIINWNMGREARITEALRRRKGVCDNYAGIFNDIAVKAGLRSFVVEGYTRQAGSIDRSGHSWCAVNLDGKWLLCDPTWDKDATADPRYFLKEPEEFISSHMPFDPMWQLLEYPVSHNEFYRGSNNKTKRFFNFSDSIKMFSGLGELKQLEATATRMSADAHANELIKNRLAYIRMLIGIIYEDKDMNLYNDAVAELNRATVFFNEFVGHRNNQFLSPGNMENINELLTNAGVAILSAHQKISGIGSIIPNNQYEPSELKNRLSLLQPKVQEQKEFLKIYMASNEAERKKLFYK